MAAKKKKKGAVKKPVPKKKPIKKAIKKPVRGKLIVIDGTDGSGKATQVKLLVERLRSQKFSIETIDFPRYKDNLFGALIRECLDGKHGDFVTMSPRIASALYAADRFESSQQIEEWLAAGKHVIADRYASANQMHQGGKIADEKERRDFLLWLDRLEHETFGIPRPDIILYLHLPLEVSLAMIMKRAEEEGKFPDEAERNTRYLFQSQQGALTIVKDRNNWVKIDCSHQNVVLPREQIAEMILGEVKKILI